MTDKSRPCCITGMHRSGTSMLAHMLHTCGLDLGLAEELIPGTPDNPDGHWEHKGFVRINDELLNQFGGGWDHPPAFAQYWQHDERLQPLRGDAAELIARFPTSGRLWGWKDPRNSLTLPFWKDLAPNLKVVICVRNPLDVAGSLRRRGLSSYRFGLELWQSYNERILDDALPERRIVVHYNSLFTDLRGELQRVAEFLELPADEDQLSLAGTMIKPHLRHHRFAIDDLIQTNVTPAIIELYLRLCEETGWSEFQQVQPSHHAPRAEAYPTKSECVAALPTLVSTGEHFSEQSARNRCETMETGQQPPLRPLNYGVIEMTELKNRQQATRPEPRSVEPTPGELKERLARLSEQLEAVQDQCRIRDNRLAQQARELAELQTELSSAAREREELHKFIAAESAEWRQVFEDLQTDIYDLSAQQRLGQTSGTETSHQIRYQQTIRRLRQVVRTQVPRAASVLVVSRGDDELLKLYGRRAAHFPQTASGAYSGYYPQCSLAAIAHLETLRAQGAEFLIFPETSRWWLEKYTDFRRHLERRYRCVLSDQETGVIFSLSQRSPLYPLAQTLDECRLRLHREPVILNWNADLDLAKFFPDVTVFSPPDAASATLPYFDRSIDLVAVSAANPEQIAEARRVATQALLLLDEAPCERPESVPTPHASDLEEFAWRVEWISAATAVPLPSVSVVIAVHNQAATTDACLRSLVTTLPESIRSEIIVIDDASTDDTPKLLERWARRDARIRWLRHEENCGFLQAAQLGAATAQGDFLLFLNNDTILLPDWLPPLLRVFRDFPLSGAVGGKLLFADGVLQEAGGMVFADASAANFGRGDHDLFAPPYNIIREVDYCSGAFLFTRRKLFERIGGFDQRFRPAYYEDTDYCFAVRRLGFRVYYQPESAIVHLEGISSGTDLSRGVKQYQVLNQAKFAEKWAATLAQQSPRPAENDRAAWVTLALNGTVREGTRE